MYWMIFCNKTDEFILMISRLLENAHTNASILRSDIIKPTFFQTEFPEGATIFSKYRKMLRICKELRDLILEISPPHLQTQQEK